MTENTKRPRERAISGGMDTGGTPMPATQTRANAVARARKRKGLTQQQLADTLGVNRVSLARIEAGARSPSMALALRIARELGESVETLFGGDR